LISECQFRLHQVESLLLCPFSCCTLSQTESSGIIFNIGAGTIPS
jgi:hypothetical protein